MHNFPNRNTFDLTLDLTFNFCLDPTSGIRKAKTGKMDAVVNSKLNCLRDILYMVVGDIIIS